MKMYLVGGAVRDELLGLPVSDRDWVVVGGHPDDLLAKGYTAVGKDFPVFLHPTTHEEYALARRERKSGPGYHGFEFDTDQSVSLEDDLSRRDLTINAIARDEDGQLIDPYGGQRDIEERTLRHISPAFIEDPVRVLRVARFMARFSSFGFTVADETVQLMRSMVDNGEVHNLVAERVWQETHGALGSRNPVAFFDTLRDCKALAVIFPEISQLDGVPQQKKWHPEIDCYIHTMMVLTQACQASDEVAVRFAALCHDLGKATTPKEILPSHHGHEERGAHICDALCERLRVPRKLHELATLSARYHTHCHRVMELKASTLLRLLKSLDVKRRPDRFDQFLTVCTADARGRLGSEDKDYPQARALADAAEAFRSVDTARIASETQDKESIAEAIRQAQLAALKRWKAQANRS